MRAAAASASSAGVPAAIDAAAPVLAAGPHEGEGVGVREIGDHLLAGREVFRERGEGQIPADAYGARAELVPPLVVDERDVLEPERGVVTRGGEAHLDPRDLAAELPCHREVERWFARGDGAARVALQLVVTADAEIARDGKEPSRDALGVRERIPHVLGRGVVCALPDDHPRRLAVVRGRHRPRAA